MWRVTGCESLMFWITCWVGDSPRFVTILLTCLRISSEERLRSHFYRPEFGREGKGVFVAVSLQVAFHTGPPDPPPRAVLTGIGDECKQSHCVLSKVWTAGL